MVLLAARLSSGCFLKVRTCSAAILVGSLTPVTTWNSAIVARVLVIENGEIGRSRVFSCSQPPSSPSNVRCGAGRAGASFSTQVPPTTTGDGFFVEFNGVVDELLGGRSAAQRARSRVLLIPIYFRTRLPLEAARGSIW